MGARLSFLSTMTYLIMLSGIEMQFNYLKLLKLVRKKILILTRGSRNKAKIASVMRKIILRFHQVATPLENVKIYIRRKRPIR